MLQIKQFTVNMLQENCYILHDETKKAVIIDNGSFFPEESDSIKNYIEKEGLIPIHLLNTHAHFDHIFGNKFIFDEYGLKAEFNKNDAELYDSVEEQLQMFFVNNLHYEPSPIGNFIKEGDKIEFGNHIIEVIETPGHSPGGVCFYCKSENVLISGDSLFQQSIGRTDLPGGNTTQLIDAIKEKIITLPGQTRVLPGHGPETTIEDERKYNIYLR